MKSGKIRIIGGRWKGKKISYNLDTALRPTPDRAKEMIINAKKGGAHAVKFQSYKAEKLASKNSPAYWDTTKEKTLSQYELFKKHDKFGENEFKILYEFCSS